MATIVDPSPMRRRPQGYNPLNRLLARSVTLNWRTVLWLVILIVAIFTRFYILGDRVMSHDESLHTRYSYNLYNEGIYQHTPLMHGPILFHMTAFMYFLFGDNDFTARLYTAALGVLMVMLPLLFQRWLGRTGALITALLLLISPIVLYYNRYIREDTPSIFFTLIMVYCVMMYLDGPLNVRRRARWLYIFSGAMLGSLGSKESAFIYIAILGSFLTLYWVARLLQHFRGLPGKTLMYFATIGILLGALAALGMYVVLSIVPPATLAVVGLGTVEGTSFVAWTLAIIAFLLVAVIGAGLWAYRGSLLRPRLSDIVVLFLVAIIACGGMILVEEVSRTATASASETAEVTDPDAEGALTSGVTSNAPIVAAWAIAAVIVAGVVITRRRGLWQKLYRFPEFDVLVVMGTLILPWLTAIILAATKADPTDYSPAGITRAVAALIPLAAISIAVGLAWNWKRWLICATIFHVLFAFFFTTMFTNVQGLATGMIGSLGYWIKQQGVRRGNQPQYYYLLIIMPFYEFLPVIGGVLAMLAGLTGFWRFRRERQAANELPALATDSLSGADAMAGPGDVSTDDLTPAEALAAEPVADDFRKPYAAAAPKRKRVPAEERLTRLPFLLLVSWWALLNMIAYTLAGEKMPWLAMHLTTPLILLTGWYFGGVFERVDWSAFWRRGWLLLLLIPLLFITLFQVVEPFLLGRSPFAGLQQQQLAALYEWLAIIAVAALVAYLIYLVAERAGGRHLRSMIGVSAFLGLALLTFRSAWMASFINYDYATEFLVYAHSAPPVKIVLNELEDISRRTTGGMDLRFAYDNETSWPNSWYYRNFPNAIFVGANPTPQSLTDTVAVVVGEANRSKVEPILEDRYFHFEYIRMWWPMQDYFNLTAARIANTFDFNPANTQAAQIRRGLFDIWWSRDYRAYSEAIGGNWNVAQWPVSDRMHLYVRKDVASQIWNMGVGDASVLTTLEDTQPNLCVANWQPRTANLVFGSGADNPLPLNHPLDVAVDAGRVYVADEFNNRISVFDTAGNYVTEIGGVNAELGTPVLNRPNGVAIGPDGNLYVADTWNYQVKVYSPDGELLRSWGQPGQYGVEATQFPEDGLWGPRDIDVDAQGNVYVADTGNKRIRVYTAEGQYLRDIGSAGSGEGQLDEPSGVVVHPDGRVFVADTWNRRVSVFSQDGQSLYTWDVRGWYDDLGNRPYLGLDAERGIIYVSDPDAGRVLVYDTYGNCLGSFGQTGEGLPEASQLNVATGITVASDGTTYVSDSRAGRILQFSPFDVIVPPPPADAGSGSVIEVTPEVGLESELTDLLELPVDATEILEAPAETTVEADDPTEETTPEATDLPPPVG